MAPYHTPTVMRYKIVRCGRRNASPTGNLVGCALIGSYCANLLSVKTNGFCCLSVYCKNIKISCRGAVSAPENERILLGMTRDFLFCNIIASLFKVLSSKKYKKGLTNAKVYDILSSITIQGSVWEEYFVESGDSGDGNCRSTYFLNESNTVCEA